MPMIAEAMRLLKRAPWHVLGDSPCSAGVLDARSIRHPDLAVAAEAQDAPVILPAPDWIPGGGRAFSSAPGPKSCSHGGSTGEPGPSATKALTSIQKMGPGEHGHLR